LVSHAYERGKPRHSEILVGRLARILSSGMKQTDCVYAVANAVPQPFIIASGAVMFDMLRLGLGRHIWAIEPTHILPLMNRLFAVYYAYNTGLVLAKASGLLFYQRVFSAPTVYRWFSVALNATHALNFGTYMGNIYLITFNNTPKAQMSTGWRPDTASLWLSAAIPSVVTDLIILFLPMPMIWKLRIGPLRKFAVFCIFVCGYR
jgi:hypothetical protein